MCDRKWLIFSHVDAAWDCDAALELALILMPSCAIDSDQVESYFQDVI